MEEDKDIQNYINGLNVNQLNLVYNIPTEKLKPHIIQFKQLMAYFNFKILIKEKLSNSNTKNIPLKEMYLIDKEWLRKWKMHIGYKSIKTFYNLYKTKNKILKIDDYDWIEPVINNNCQIILSPLNNNNIHDNINYSEFIIVDKECYSLFSLNFIKEQKKLNSVKNYEIRLYYEKLILIISETVNLLKFKVKELNCNFELLIIFDKKNNNQFFEEIANCDMNHWIKKYNFDLLSQEQKEFKGFTILNKTLIFKKSKSINFDKNNIIREGIMKATQKLSNNMLQSIAINQKNLESQFLLRARAGKSFENEMSLTKKFNNNKLEKPNTETINHINNRRNNRVDNNPLSQTQMHLDKIIKDKNAINTNDFNEYLVLGSNNKQPQINLQINNFNNFSNNIPNYNNNSNYNNFNNNFSNNNNYNNNNCMNNFMNNNNNINNNYGQLNNMNQNMGQFGINNQNNFMMNNNNNFNINNNNNLINFNNNNFNNQNFSGFNCNFNNNFNSDFNNNFNNNINNQGNYNMSMPMPMLMNNNNMISFNNNIGMNNNMFMNNMLKTDNNNINNMNMFNNMFFNNNNNINHRFSKSMDISKVFNQNNNMMANSSTTIVKPLPHKIGLQNIGQTCYMNASLQCLTNVEKISKKLLQMFNQNIINIQQQPLTYVYSSLLYEFKITDKSYIIPQTFKATLEELNPLFQGNQASDAKDFIFFMIERLHQELKPPENPLNNFAQIDFFKQEMEARNQMLTLNKFLNEFRNNSSIISDTFYGITSSQMKCEGCQSIKYSFQTFNILNFILKKVKEDKSKEFGEENLRNNVINLYDAFYSENKKENLTGENMIYCNTCKALKNGWVQQSIYQLPQIMIIILNRGRNNKDFREEFQINEILDFNNTPNIFCNIDNQKKYKKYFLCGIVKHLGESGSNGHFISYYRNSINQKFYCYNDASVAEVSVEDAMKTKISRNENEDMIPYILFYHYKH